MDRRERANVSKLNALLLAVKAALDDRQANIWTALPATVNTYNPGAVTVSAQPLIQAQVRQPDGTWVDTQLPLCADCPVQFPGGGGFVLTWPLVKGNEGILVFASRCIDAWWQNGGIQKQAELRMHDLSDGFFLPSGGMSQPNIPGSPSGNTCQLRSHDGTTYVEITGNKIVNIVAPEGINFTGPATFNSGVTFLGEVSGHAGGGGNINFGGATLQNVGDVETGTVTSLNAHIHSGVQPGSGDSGPPSG